MRHHRAAAFTQPSQLRLIFVFATLLFAGVMSQPPNALGDTIIFHDLTDTITLEHIGTSDTLTILSCPTTEGIGSSCVVSLSRAGASTVSGIGGFCQPNYYYAGAQQPRRKAKRVRTYY